MIAMVDPQSAQAVIGGVAGIVVGVLLMVTLMGAMAILAFKWLQNQWESRLEEHEEREEAKARERHEELRNLIALLQERVDRLYERQAG